MRVLVMSGLRWVVLAVSPLLGPLCGGVTVMLVLVLVNGSIGMLAGRWGVSRSGRRPVPVLIVLSAAYSSALYLHREPSISAGVIVWLVALTALLWGLHRRASSGKPVPSRVWWAGLGGGVLAVDLAVTLTVALRWWSTSLDWTTAWTWFPYSLMLRRFGGVRVAHSTAGGETTDRFSGTSRSTSSSCAASTPC